MFFTKNDPIIACSSGEGMAAISLIRISSPDSIENILKCFSLKKELKPRYASYCALKNGDELLDEILLTYFPAPESYTGENILELAVHGNPINVRRVIQFFHEKYNIRLAEGGEFTYRALKNKKLTLSQVEGLDLFLNAQSREGLLGGLAALRGELHQEFQKLRENFIKLKSSIELFTDFSEDVGEAEAQNLFNQAFDVFEEQINGLYERSQGNFNSLLDPRLF